MATDAITSNREGSSPRPSLLLKAPSWVWDVVGYLPPFAAVGSALAANALLRTYGPPIVRRNETLVAGMVGGVALLFIAKWQLQRFFSDGPRYEVEGRVGDLELRRYAPTVVAQTTVETAANFDEALNEGFRRVAGYIFGGNRSRKKFDMTSPVTAQREEGERIAMTSPVTVSGSGGTQTVAFIMPSEYSLEDLPRPNDTRVDLRELPARRVAVLRYSGRYSGEQTEPQQEALIRKVEAAGLRPMGPPSFAGYDPPSTLPFLRRNEVWVEVA